MDELVGGVRGCGCGGGRGFREGMRGGRGYGYWQGRRGGGGGRGGGMTSR